MSVWICSATPYLSKKGLSSAQTADALKNAGEVRRRRGENLEPQTSMRTLTFVRRKGPLARKPYVKVYVERRREGSQGNARSRVT